MFHKKFAQDLRNNLNPEAPRPRLVRQGETVSPNAVPELRAIALRRGAAFFAEAAVLVLVFGLLDVFLQRGHIEAAWLAGAVLLSLGLLAASIFTDFSARRWSGAMP